jgi:exopolysaccharide biosynthesis predicted pyruvyltransferase EpsI
MTRPKWQDDTPRTAGTTEDLQIALKRRIGDVLLPLISGRGERIHLIDPPDHPNVGHCAILLGELDFFRRELPNSQVAFHDWSTYSPSAGRHIERASVLLMHGGGNFGDIWPHHHQFRLKILRRFPTRPTIQLAQSIHFDSPVALQETRDAIAGHSDFTLLARDTKSEAFARANFDCRVELCPDMAFAMDRIVRKPATVDALCLLRTDKEAVAPHEEISVSSQVNAALDRLSSLVEGIKQVSAHIAHDLKTPLNRLQMVLEVAADKADRGKAVSDDLAEARSDGLQINETFDALLRIAQIEAGARKARFIDLDLEGVVETIADIYADLAEDDGMSLSAKTFRGTECLIHGDRELLTQMFANLVENALRHCPQGTAVELSVTRHGDRVLAQVGDNGPGIPAEEREKVFQRLYPARHQPLDSRQRPWA